MKDVLPVQKRPVYVHKQASFAYSLVLLLLAPLLA
jgi:hypothetical protein